LDCVSRAVQSNGSTAMRGDVARTITIGGNPARRLVVWPAEKNIQSFSMSCAGVAAD
jgi:hypothetical protein